MYRSLDDDAEEITKRCLKEMNERDFITSLIADLEAVDHHLEDLEDWLEDKSEYQAQVYSVMRARRALYAAIVKLSMKQVGK